MSPKTAKYLDCIKPLFEGYYGYLRKEFDLLMHVRRTSNLAQFIEQYLIEQPSDSKYHEDLLKTSSELALTASSHYENDFDSYHKSSLVNLFSAFELTLEEFITNTIYTYPDSLMLIPDAIQSKAIQDKLPISTFDDAQGLLKILKRINFGKKITGVSTYTELLKHLDINLIIEDEVFAHLDELKEVRNCIVHKGAVIDKKSVENAPSLSSFEGEVFKVGFDLYKEYYNSIKIIHSALTSAVIKSSFYVSKAK